jgi:competence ComEA-like helix-hairpin-helix protein
MIRQIALTLSIAASLCSAAAQSTTPPPAAAPLPNGPGKAIVQRACVACHTLGVITSKRTTPDGWSQVVNEMVSRGADLSDDEIDTLTRYLSASFGPVESKIGSDRAQEAAATPPSPDKPDKPDKPAEPASSNAPTSSVSAPLNVNKASSRELESSLGLSKQAAEAIVQYRAKHGNFNTWQEVSSVPGVPRETIENNQKRITF